MVGHFAVPTGRDFCSLIGSVFDAVQSIKIFLKTPFTDFLKDVPHETLPKITYKG